MCSFFMKRETILETRHISKTFGTVTALNRVNFSLYTGEIHGLLGENGAGKSTLMNILYGLYRADEGELLLSGTRVHITSPLDSIRHGIGMIHQSSTLVPEFTALENIILGTQGKGWSLNLSDERTQIYELASRLKMDFPLNARIRELSAGICQKIEIIRALYRGANILILDEPTTSLVEDEFDQLLDSLQVLIRDGMAVVFITHKIREVLQACHRASVLKDGEMQGTVSIKHTSQKELVTFMFGREDLNVNDSALPVVDLPDVEVSRMPLCEVRGLTVPAREKEGVSLQDISFDVYGGEILGIAGISGNGQKELAESMIHPKQLSGGRILINGQDISGYSPLDVFACGVFYTPEDRKQEAMLPLGDIKENMLLGHHAEEQFVRHKLVNWGLLKRRTLEMISEFSIKTPDETLAISKLSGGNIQRVVIARALLNPIKLLITHNPTSGLDMASVKFVFEKLLELKQKGSAVLYVNEDLDELMVVCDRIGVIHEGRLVGFFTRAQFEKHAIGTLMIGG